MKHALLSCLLLSAVALAADGATVVHVFPGQNGPHPADSPARSVDTMGGVGPRHLVGFINGGVTIRAKTDGKELAPYQTQLQFWQAALKNAGGGEPSGHPYDPRIFFDPLTSRWFAIADEWRFAKDGGACCMDHVLIGVSRDDDPTHPWKAIDFEAKTTLDNAKFGIDRNGFYLTELEASRSDTPQGALLAIPKSDLLWKGDAKPSLAHLNRLPVEMFTRMSDHKLRGVEGMLPMFDVDAKKKTSAPEYFVNRYRAEVDGETIIQVRTITWTSPTTARLSEPTDVGLGTHYPIQPTTRAVQPPLGGGLYSPGLTAGEGRLVNAVVRNGSVWTISATEINNHTAAFWVEIDVKTMKVKQQGQLADPEADILFPSVMVDKNGNLGIIAMRSSATEAPSTYVTGRSRTDPPSRLRPLARAVPGRYPYIFKTNDLSKPNEVVSTSDYATSVLDPSDPTLIWSFQFAATNDCMPKEENGGRYATHWVAYRVGPTKKSH